MNKKLLNQIKNVKKSTKNTIIIFNYQEGDINKKYIQYENIEILELIINQYPNLMKEKEYCLKFFIKYNILYPFNFNTLNITEVFVYTKNMDYIFYREDFINVNPVNAPINNNYDRKI